MAVEIDVGSGKEKDMGVKDCSSQARFRPYIQYVSAFFCVPPRG